MRSPVRLPTALPFSRSSQRPRYRGSWKRSEGFAVISRYFNRVTVILPQGPHWAEVPNRGVDWSSRPRRACYPWGNFSVTSSPQQRGLGGSLGHTFVAESSAFKLTVRLAFGLALNAGDPADVFRAVILNRLQEFLLLLLVCQTQNPSSMQTLLGLIGRRGRYSDGFVAQSS